MTNVILVHEKGNYEKMGFSHLSGELPNIIRLFSMLDEPIKLKLYKKTGEMFNGLPVYKYFEVND